MGEISAAKTQLLHSQALERVAPSYHPHARVAAPRLQQPIFDGPTRTQLLDPKAATTGSFKFDFEKRNTKRLRGPKLAGSLRERIVLRSLLPDSLKMDCLERLDKREKELEEKAAELRGEGQGESKGPQRRRSIFDPPPVPGGFHEGQHVMARRDLYLEGDHIMAAFMDKAVVLGPSRSSDPNRICVKFEERRDGGSMWVNVMPDEIMSEENGALMQKYIEIGKLRSRRPPPPPTPELEAPPDGIHYWSFDPCGQGGQGLEVLRITPWTSSVKRGVPQGEPRQKIDRGKLLRDSQSLPALLGGLNINAYLTA